MPGPGRAIDQEDVGMEYNERRKLPIEDRWKLPPLTVRQLDDLPPRVELVEAALLLGYGEELAREARKAGEFPIPVLKIGQRHFVNLSDLLRELGIERAA
jgi:hypothetical protein